jgi:hypothetical protein
VIAGVCVLRDVFWMESIQGYKFKLNFCAAGFFTLKFEILRIF